MTTIGAGVSRAQQSTTWGTGFITSLTIRNCYDLPSLSPSTPFVLFVRFVVSAAAERHTFTQMYDSAASVLIKPVVWTMSNLSYSLCSKGLTKFDRNSASN
jgi:hypothetical protein